MTLKTEMKVSLCEPDHIKDFTILHRIQSEGWVISSIFAKIYEGKAVDLTIDLEKKIVLNEF